MKEPFAMERGRVVRSTQGRDKGRYFLILDRGEKDLAWIADGLTHPLTRPKKKKIRHVHAEPIVVNLETIRPEGGKVQDSDLRRALESHGFAVERSLCKEG